MHLLYFVRMSLKVFLKIIVEEGKKKIHKSIYIKLKTIFKFHNNEKDITK